MVESYAMLNVVVRKREKSSFSRDEKEHLLSSEVIVAEGLSHNNYSTQNLKNSSNIFKDFC